MTETKPEAMTAERMEAVRRRAEYLGRLNRAGYFARGSNTLELAACLEDEVPALLSALEEAREDIAGLSGDIRQCDAILDAALGEARPDTMAAEVLHERLPRLVKALEEARAAKDRAVDDAAEVIGDLERELNTATAERDEAKARLADALDSLATMAGHRDVLAEERDALRLERATLAARVAELEVALHSARAALERLASQYEQEHDPWERPAWVMANLPPAAPPEKAPAPERAFNMLAHLAHQREWSERTFGPGHRPAGLIDHIRKELKEIEREPNDLTEWIDVVILALDGAWRSGHSPAEIIAALVAKQAKNESRQWPDWRTAAPGQAIEHIRETEPPAGVTIHGGPEAALWLATPAEKAPALPGRWVMCPACNEGFEASDQFGDAPKRAPSSAGLESKLDVLVEEFGTKLAAATPAADPLCARDLGGRQKCGHPLSEHPGQTITGLPLGCHHVFVFSDGVRGWCPCPGFVPEPSPRLTDAQQRDAAALMAATEPAGLDAPGDEPDMGDAKPLGVVDHGTARTCAQCGRTEADHILHGYRHMFEPSGSTTEGGKSNG